MNEKIKVGILLGTYNGEKYLKEQIDSLIKQSYKNWQLFISDDQSSDGTFEILENLKIRIGEDRVNLIQGTHRGFAQNFLHLVRSTQNLCDYYAFCDQDDVWDEDKIFRAVNKLSNAPENSALLYCTNSRYITQDGRHTLDSYVFKKPPQFKNALVQCIAGANTMFFNNHTSKVLALTSESANLCSHDWWTYQLVTGIGGYVIYDPKPSLDYRQHSGALVGENRSLRAKLIRIIRLLQGRYRKWNEENVKELMRLKFLLTDENKKTLHFFQSARQRFILLRVYYFIRSGAKRQTLAGNIALFLAVVLKKI